MAAMRTESLTPADFSPALFWDIDPGTLDIERHLKYVVARVLEAGTLDDWMLLCRQFTLPGIIDIARRLRSLDPRALAFLSVVGHVPRETFRCFTSKPLTPAPWTY
jgi:hypothetical protein